MTTSDPCRATNRSPEVESARLCTGARPVRCSPTSSISKLLRSLVTTSALGTPVLEAPPPPPKTSSDLPSLAGEARPAPKSENELVIEETTRDSTCAFVVSAFAGAVDLAGSVTSKAEGPDKVCAEAGGSVSSAG
eukprot:scaffold82095_cov29-Tisochrysis_lutea.AAC.2